MADLEFEAVMDVIDRAPFDEQRSAVIEDRVEAVLSLGGHSELCSELEQLVAAQPLRERRWGQLMLALYRSDRQADALVAYGRARDLLLDELGLDPSAELQDLEARILNHDPTLAPPAVTLPRPAAGVRDLRPCWRRAGDGVVVHRSPQRAD